jgi:hypothetical protein
MPDITCLNAFVKTKFSGKGKQLDLFYSVSHPPVLVKQAKYLIVTQEIFLVTPLSVSKYRAYFDC